MKYADTDVHLCLFLGGPPSVLEPLPLMWQGSSRRGPMGVLFVWGAEALAKRTVPPRVPREPTPERRTLWAK